MTPRDAAPADPIAVRGDERALALAGPPADRAAVAGPAVHLGEPADPPGDGDVVWLPGSGEALTKPSPAQGKGGFRVIATGGDGLWGRAPWPAGDALFELPPPPEPFALVAGGDAERRAHVVEKLEARGLPVRGAELLTAGDLADATVVALLGAADAATPEAPWAATAMPAEAPAVLAARRVLIAPRSTATFGLLPGTDHLAFATGDDAVQYADAVLTYPASFAPLTVMGARTAEHHRASAVYARLAEELRSAPRSAAPRG